MVGYIFHDNGKIQKWVDGRSVPVKIKLYEGEVANAWDLAEVIGIGLKDC